MILFFQPKDSRGLLKLLISEWSHLFLLSQPLWCTCNESVVSNILHLKYTEWFCYPEQTDCQTSPPYSTLSFFHVVAHSLVLVHWLFCFLIYCLSSKCWSPQGSTTGLLLCYILTPWMMEFSPLPKYWILSHIFISCEISLWGQDYQLKISSLHFKSKYLNWSYLHSMLSVRLFCHFSPLFHISPVS